MICNIWNPTGQVSELSAQTQPTFLIWCNKIVSMVLTLGQSGYKSGKCGYSVLYPCDYRRVFPFYCRFPLAFSVFVLSLLQVVA